MKNQIKQIRYMTKEKEIKTENGGLIYKANVLTTANELKP